MWGGIYKNTKYVVINKNVQTRFPSSDVELELDNLSVTGDARASPATDTETNEQPDRQPDR